MFFRKALAGKTAKTIEKEKAKVAMFWQRVGVKISDRKSHPNIYKHNQTPHSEHGKEATNLYNPSFQKEPTKRTTAPESLESFQHLLGTLEGGRFEAFRKISWSIGIGKLSFPKGVGLNKKKASCRSQKGLALKK